MYHAVISYDHSPPTHKIRLCEQINIAVNLSAL